MEHDREEAPECANLGCRMGASAIGFTTDAPGCKPTAATAGVGTTTGSKILAATILVSGSGGNTRADSGVHSSASVAPGDFS